MTTATEPTAELIPPRAKWKWRIPVALPLFAGHGAVFVSLTATVVLFSTDANSDFAETIFLLLFTTLCLNQGALVGFWLAWGRMFIIWRVLLAAVFSLLAAQALWLLMAWANGGWEPWYSIFFDEAYWQAANETGVFLTLTIAVIAITFAPVGIARAFGYTLTSCGDADAARLLHAKHAQFHLWHLFLLTTLGAVFAATLGQFALGWFESLDWVLESVSVLGRWVLISSVMSWGTALAVFATKRWLFAVAGMFALAGLFVLSEVLLPPANSDLSVFEESLMFALHFTLLTLTFGYLRWRGFRLLRLRRLEKSFATSPAAEEGRAAASAPPIVAPETEPDPFAVVPFSNETGPLHVDVP